MADALPAPQPCHAAPPATVYSLDDLDFIAQHAAASAITPQVRNDRSGALMLLLRCQAEGIHPGLAFATFHVIEGQPAMRADAMHARFMQRGGRILWVRSDDDACEARFFHSSYPDPEGFRVAVTRKEIDDKGISKGKDGTKANWRRFSAQMLRARVISQGVRAILPEVVVGIYTVEEAQDSESAPARLQDPVRQPVRVERTQAPAKALEPPPPAQPSGPVTLRTHVAAGQIQACERTLKDRVARANSEECALSVRQVTDYVFFSAARAGLMDPSIDHEALTPAQRRVLFAALASTDGDWVAETVEECIREDADPGGDSDTDELEGAYALPSGREPREEG